MSDIKGYLPYETVVKLIWAAKENERDFLLMMTLFFTGRRVSEIVGLAYEKDIDEETQKGKWIYTGRHIGGLKPVNVMKDRAYIRFDILKKRKPKQATKPIPDRLHRHLLAYIQKKQIKDDKRIFPITRQRVDQIVKKYAKRIGIDKVGEHKMHAHVFRHSYSIRFLDKTHNIRKLQMLLEHSDLRYTSQYLQYSESDLARDVENSFS